MCHNRDAGFFTDGSEPCIRCWNVVTADIFSSNFKDTEGKEPAVQGLHTVIKHHPFTTHISIRNPLAASLSPSRHPFLAETFIATDKQRKGKKVGANLEES